MNNSTETQQPSVDALDAAMILIAVERFFRDGYEHLTTGWGWPLFALESALQAAVHKATRYRPTSVGQLVTVAELSFWLDRVRLARCAVRSRAADELTRLGNFSYNSSEWLWGLAARVTPRAKHYEP